MLSHNLHLELCRWFWSDRQTRVRKAKTDDSLTQGYRSTAVLQPQLDVRRQVRCRHVAATASMLLQHGTLPNGQVDSESQVPRTCFSEGVHTVTSSLLASTENKKWKTKADEPT